MRKKLLGLMVLAGLGCVLLIPALGLGQVGQNQPAGKKKAKGAGGAQPGGFDINALQQQVGGAGKKKGAGGIGGIGGLGAGGANGLMNLMGNSDQLFDMLAKGADAININSLPAQMRGMFANFADDNGFSNGLISRDDFRAMVQSATSMIQQGGAGGLGGAGTALDPDVVAARNFQRADKDQDGKLNEFEMPANLKAVWQQYDTNKDGFIDLEEYKVFYRTIAQRQTGGKGSAGAGVAFMLLEDDYSERPKVFRAGKLPPGLPAWFNQLDADKGYGNKDGQVSLYEWRNAGKSIAEFQLMDRNGDGLLTAEEVLYYMKSISGANLYETTIMGPQGAIVAGGGFGGGKKGAAGPGGGNPKGKKGGGGPGGAGGFDPATFNPGGAGAFPGGGAGAGAGGKKGGAKGGKKGGG